MKILYTTDGVGNLTTNDNIFIFTAAKSVEIQPGEIKKVPTGVVLRVEKGYAVHLTTHPLLIEKIGQLFPASSMLTNDSPEDYIFLMVQNSGRNPFLIRPGDALSRGFVTPIEPVDTENYTPETPAKSEVSRSRPQRRNAEIEFEVK